jgi:hypothetical protein
MIAFVLTLIFATSGFIGGGGPGSPNVISSGSDWGFIGGGNANTISAGRLHSFIGGGQANTVDADRAVVVGGSGNIVTGANSAILGGTGNNDGGVPNMGLYGQGLTATPIPSVLGAFWANELVIPNIPMGNLVGGVPVPPPLYPPGSLWYYPDANLNNVVYVV